jgi:hypothetical protein
VSVLPALPVSATAIATVSMCGAAMEPGPDQYLCV